MFGRLMLAQGAIFALLALPARAAERDYVRTFAAPAGSTLKIDSHRGTIEVAAGDVHEARIAVHLEIGTESETEADQLVSQLQLTFAQQGNTIAVRARNPAETRWRWSWNDDKQIGLTFRVTVPRQCNLDLAVRRGSITVGDLTGRMKAETEDGTVFFHGVNGSVEARTDTGDVIMSHCTGAVNIHVRQGLIRVGTIGGPADLQNGGGDIDILLARGEVTARAEAGDISVGFPRHIQPGTRLATSGGSILAKIDPAAACEVDASSRWGRIRSPLPFAAERGAIGRSQFTGRLNGGGPLLVLKASGGDVKVVGAEMPFE